MMALRGGSREEGLGWLHRALREDPHYEPALKALADCYAHRGDHALGTEGRPPTAAKAADTRAFAREGMRGSQVLYQVGMAALRTGAFAEGLRWLNDALRENPNHAPTRAALTNYYQHNWRLQSYIQVSRGGDRLTIADQTEPRP